MNKDIDNSGLQKSEDFDSLVRHIQDTSDILQQDARLVINRNVTTRAWLTGFYIVEYEQHGKDRAKYGEHLIQELSQRLGGKSYGVSNLRNFRQFFLYYPELKPVIVSYLKERFSIHHSTNGKLKLLDIHHSLNGESEDEGKRHTVPEGSAICVPSQVSRDGFAMQLASGEIMPVPQMLFSRLSFTHIVRLLHLDDPMKRTFYAIEAMRGPWSVRELQRQIDSNYYERSGWSKKPELLANKVHNKAEKPSFRQELKSHYIFEFLGLAAKDVIEEGELEQALIDHLEEFMLELGMGFCLESRQKKLLIDDRYFKADLVFYHRILKCHCIVELKAHRLDYADVAQLNMYIEYYRRHYMLPGDNPPVGLLLCTEYGQEMVEYVTPNIDPNLFVAQYELQLPSKEKMMEFLMNENRN